MIFLSAQHISTYYLWQLRVCTANLSSLGVLKINIHVLFAQQQGEHLSNEDSELVNDIEKVASVFYYSDNRTRKSYQSSIRPHIIYQHFLKFPDLQKQTFFYHDCDIIFRKLPPLLDEIVSDTWYVSETSNYLNSKYVKLFIGEGNFLEMCNIVGLPPSDVIEQDRNCGGAQYIMKNLTAEFWKKVEIDSESIYTFLESVNQKIKINLAISQKEFYYSKGIQSWCADMWAVLWNALYYGHSVKTHTDMNFCWPHYPIEAWQKNYILHNAGVMQNQAEQIFYKGNYVYNTPFFESLSSLNKRYCSYIYASFVKTCSLNKGTYLEDVTFLIPLMIDSLDRLDNIYTSVRYLKKQFSTQVMVLEYGKERQINSQYLPDNVTSSFIEEHATILHRNSFINQIIDGCNTQYICFYDADIIIPKKQLIEAATLLRDNLADIVYPYDGNFISMDKLSTSIFSKFLDDIFLEANKQKFTVSARSSVVDCVMINRAKYKQRIKDSEKHTSCRHRADWFNINKVLGSKTRRTEGVLYQMQ